jgi:hypothetical protein
MMELDLDRGVVLTSELLNSLIAHESDETASSIVDDAAYQIKKMDLLKVKATHRHRHHRQLQQRRKRENIRLINLKPVPQKWREIMAYIILRDLCFDANLTDSVGYIILRRKCSDSTLNL